MSLPTNKKYYNYLQSFRAFAVLNVVARHAVMVFYFGNASGYPKHELIPLTNEVLFRGCTMYFTIISGILFSSVFKEQGYKRFYTNKLLYLVIPYIFFSVCLTLFKNIHYVNVNVDVDFKDFFSALPLNILCGKADFALWYVPIFIIICMITPLLDFLLHKNTVTKCIFVLFIVAPLYFTRVLNINTNYIRIETLIYFIGPYAIGMYCGLNMEKTIQLIKKNLIFMVSIVLLSTAILIYIRYNKIFQVGDVTIAESFFYIQKVALAGILIWFFRQREDNQPAWMKMVAKDSLPVYFMHGYVQALISPVLYFMYAYKNIYPLNIIVAVTIIAFASFFICKAIIYLLRKLSGSRAKMLLGSA